MKRLHFYVKVTDLKQAMNFYSSLFAMEPTVIKDDYAKWMVDDPRVNFAISTNGDQPSIDHLGIQVEDNDELSEVYARLDQAGRPVLEEGKITCCYAKQEKSWITDLDELPWETFQTFKDSTVYGTNEARATLKKTAKDDAGIKSICCS
jgi:predicted enzyme related to lactoylglutathione lyase